MRFRIRSAAKKALDAAIVSAGPIILFSSLRSDIGTSLPGRVEVLVVASSAIAGFFTEFAVDITKWIYLNLIYPNSPMAALGIALYFIDKAEVGPVFDSTLPFWLAFPMVWIFMIIFGVGFCSSVMFLMTRLGQALFPDSFVVAK